MSVGYPTTKTDIDMRAGGLVQVIRDNFDAVVRMKAWLDATPDNVLTAAPYGYTAGEVAILKSAFADLATLVTLSRGTGTQGSAKNSFAFANQLVGLS